MTFSFEYYSEAVRKQIRALSDGHRAELSHIVYLMEDLGTDLGLPHTRAMGGGLLEIRLSDGATQARIFYCSHQEDRIILLHTFIKKTPQTPSREIELARKRMKEIKNGRR